MSTTAFLTAAFIVIFVTANIILLRLRMKRKIKKIFPPLSAETAKSLDTSLKPERFILPSGLFFYQKHTWARVLFSGRVKIGLDDFTQKIIGKITGVSFLSVGSQLKHGQPFAVIHQSGRTVFLSSPVEGKISALNHDLGWTKLDPYGHGWLMEVEPSNLKKTLLKLKTGETAQAWLEKELARFQRFLYTSLVSHKNTALNLTATDSGCLTDGILERLDIKVWRDFEAEFLA